MKLMKILMLVAIFISLICPIAFSGNADAASDIISVRVFTGFQQEGDWLIVLMYDTDIEDCDDSHKWEVELIDVDISDDPLEQRQLKYCGYRPGCIYLSAQTVENMDWGGNHYDIQIEGMFAPNPYYRRHIESSDWVGDDLDKLDDWCISSAQDMGVAVNASEGAWLYVTTGPDGYVLNSDGCAVFENGIPGLGNERGDQLCVVGVEWVHPDWDANIGNMSYNDWLADQWDEAVGPEIAGLWTDVGDYFGVGGRWIGMACVIIGFIFLAMWSKTIAFGIILAGTVIGIFPLWFLGVIVAILLFIFLKSFWLSST